MNTYIEYDDYIQAPPRKPKEIPEPEPEPTTENRSRTYNRTVEPQKTYVYYLSDGHGRIKIGLSQNPWGRVYDMKCACPDAELLACEYAGMDVLCSASYGGITRQGIAKERLRQQQFKSEHASREWFTASDRLLDWVDLVKLSQSWVS